MEIVLMQYRFYIARKGEPLIDTQGILLEARRVYEIEAELDEKSLELILTLFCPYSDDGLSFEAAKGCVRTVFKRDGRSDRGADELRAIISSVKPKAEAKVRGGMEFRFKSTAFAEEIKCFISDNLSDKIYCLDEKRSEEGDAYESSLCTGFCDADFKKLEELRAHLGIKMDIDDLMCVQNYFISESRDPSLAEIRIIDCFFSENFRHTTFETILDGVVSDDPRVRAAWEHYESVKGENNASLSDITRAAARELEDGGIVRATEKLNGIKFTTADVNENYLLLVKNESHNRSTTVDPYNGAQGSIAGAVRDLLCAFGYAFDAYRVVGVGTDEKSSRDADISAAGFAENASVLGIPCTKCKETVSEIYEDKRLEVCSVLAVADGASAEKVMSKEPLPDDKIYLVGGRTGCDGTVCHTPKMKKCGEYIPVNHGGELAALQRLFTRKAFADIAVAVNDIGSGGVVCALGEIVSGADVYCAELKLKYGGVSFADAILSESTERMVVCVRNENTERLESLCKAEGVECTRIAKVNDSERFIMYNDKGERLASFTRAFLVSGGAEKHLSAYVPLPEELPESEALELAKSSCVKAGLFNRLLGIKDTYDLDNAYRRSASFVRESHSELKHVYDRSAGGNAIDTDSVHGNDISLRRIRHCGRLLNSSNGRPLCSALACGSFPEISGIDPYMGGYLSVQDAVLKLVAAGHGGSDIYLALQEYFPEHKNSSLRLGTSVASMLGVFEAQMSLGVSSIGGRISIGSGNERFANNATVTAFAFCVTDEAEHVGSSFVKKGNKVVLLNSDAVKNDGLMTVIGATELACTVEELKQSGVIRSAAAVNARNVCSVVMEMSRGGRTGLVFDPSCDLDTIFGNTYGAILCEIDADAALPKKAKLIGRVADDYRLTDAWTYFELTEAFRVKERRLPRNRGDRSFVYLKKDGVEGYGKIKTVDGGKPKVLMPMTQFSVAQNEIRAAFEKAGADVRLMKVNAVNVPELVKVIKKTDIVWLSDENGPSGLLGALLNDKRVLTELLELRARKGLIYGWGSAFDALVGSGLLGIDPSKLRFEHGSGRMVSEAVGITAVSVKNAFMHNCEVTESYRAYVVGKGLRLKCEQGYLNELAKNGRVCTQFCKDKNAAECDDAVDSVTSEDGLVFAQVSRPLLGEGSMHLIESAVGYFSTYATM